MADFATLAEGLYGTAPVSGGDTALTAGGIAAQPATPPAAKSAAESLYPSAEQAAPVERAQFKASTDEELAAALHPEPKEVVLDIPENIKALRKADGARAMYIDTGLSSALPDNGLDHVDDFAPEMKQAFVKEVRNIFQDVGLGAGDAIEFRAMAKQMQADPPTAEQVAQWHKEASVQLVATYGKDGAQRALEGAQALVMRDPRLAKMFEANGLGNRPEVVMRFAELARRQPR